jgi:hypothetical protein
VQRVVALGRLIGGAQGIPRFTSWTGTVRAVKETEQPFELFGGPDAIAVTDLALAGAGGVVLGAWARHGAPSGVAVWFQSGETWQRTDEAPGLASEVTAAGSELTSPAAVTTRDGDVVLVGWTVHLGGGHVQLRASFWEQHGAGWQEERLPTEGDGQARAVACGDQECTVVGSDRGRLAIWEVASGRGRRLPAPHLMVAPGAPVLATRSGDTVWLAVGEGGASHVLRLSEGRVEAAAAPPGLVTALAAVGPDSTGPTALVRGEDGATSLWRLSP